MINKRGFTLAEVLITIGIIGVIASVTLPALNSNLIKSQLEVQTEKFYTQFSRAMDLYKVDNGVDYITGMDFNAEDFIKKYFNYSKRCTTATECYADQYQKLGKDVKFVEPSTWFKDGVYTYALSDGTVFTFEDFNTVDEPGPLTLVFDTNGRKGPNKAGYDLWSVKVFDDGSIDEEGITPEVRKDTPGEELDKIVQDKLAECTSGENYYGCFGHFRRNNFKIDY